MQSILQSLAIARLLTIVSVVDQAPLVVVERITGREADALNFEVARLGGALAKFLAGLENPMKAVWAFNWTVGLSGA